MSKSCFFIGPIGPEDSEIRKWSDDVLDYIVSPAAKDLGYDSPVRADKISGVPSISFAIMKHLVNDDLVVADLTGGNPNAFYELAIRHALKRPVVHIMRDGEKIPFDVHDVQVVFVNTDVRKADIAKNALKNQINAVEGKEFLIPYIDSIQELKILFESNRSSDEKEGILNLLERLESLRSGVNDLKIDVSTLVRYLIGPKSRKPIDNNYRERSLKKVELARSKQNKKKETKNK